MRSSQCIHLVYFLSLLTILVCAGCARQAKPIPEVTPAPVPAPTIKQPVEEYSNNKYEAGDENYPDGYYIHTVSVPNENISIIAKWYTGEKKNWVVLTKCNPTINPNRIFLGNKIKIPLSIMTRHNKLPSDFVHQSNSKTQRQKIPKVQLPEVQTTTPAAQPAAEEQLIKPTEQEPLFFGPKPY